MTTDRSQEIRFRTPLYTITEAAAHLQVPRSTFETWVRGYERRPPGRSLVRGRSIVTSVETYDRQAEIPFIGLVEGMVVASFRRSGISMQRVRRALEVVADQVGLEYALASQRLFTDGADILYDYAAEEHEGALKGLTVVTSGQRVFAPVILEYLNRITYAADGWAERMALPVSDKVAVDPYRAFGQPMFIHGAVRLEDVLDRFRAGDSLIDVAQDFKVPLEDIEEVIRASLPSAA